MRLALNSVALGREMLDRDYTPERASKLCGTSPELIRELASLIAESKAMSGVAGSCIPKLYHGDLIMRPLPEIRSSLVDLRLSVTLLGAVASLSDLP